MIVYPYTIMPNQNNIKINPSSRIQPVQGLRALAVLAVLLFHAKVAGIAGGFLGVDVFFVISGFVITLLLRKQIEKQQFSFAEFYQRRAWRLMPALAFTLLFSAILFGFLMPTSENPTLLYALISAAFGISNFYFNNTLDYFDSGISNPILHTWSLGVEEQFYLAFPLLLWFLYRNTSGNSLNAIRNTILTLTVVGFATAVYQTSTSQSSAFYLPWFRAWEFLSGAAVAFVNIKQFSNGFAKACSWLGLTLLIPTILFYHEHYIFPGIGALVPVLGTLLLLLGSQSENSINTVLASKPFRLIGDMSYSIYLVHWPIVCFLGLFVSLTNPITQVLVIVASLIFGFLSWHFVEQRFRHGLQILPSIKGAITPIFLMVSSVCILLTATLATNVFWNQFPSAKQHFTEAHKYNDLFREGQCFIVSGTIDQYDQQTCLTLSNDKENVIVMGDSLAANLVTVMQKRWPERNFMQATALDYIPGNALKWSPIAKALDEIVQTQYKQQPQKFNTFILYAFWQEDDILPLQKRIKALKDNGHQVIVLGPSPQLYVGAPVILAHSEIFQYDFGAHLFKKNRINLDAQFKEAAAQADQYISTYQTLCTNGDCKLRLNNELMFFDKVHLTKPGADYLVNHLVALN